jgi:hypothetical protein
MVIFQSLAADLFDNAKDPVVPRHYASRQIVLQEWFTRAWLPAEPVAI